VLSDTSSDSGVIEDVRVLASPGLDDGPIGSAGRLLLSPGLDSPVYSPANSVDLIDYLSNGESAVMVQNSYRYNLFANKKYILRSLAFIKECVSFK
jgi:hypothetical protein